jgi:hypothetical protein
MASKDRFLPYHLKFQGIVEDPFWFRLCRLRILLKIDENGSIVDMPNWQEVKAKSMAVAAEMTAQLKKLSGLPEEQILKIEQQVTAMYATREQIIQNTTKEAQLFFFAFGREYSLTEPVVYRSLLANPFGGDQFPAKTVLKLESMDQKSDLAKISWYQQLDEVETQRIMLETMNAIASRLGRAGSPPGEVPSMKINDTGQVQVVMSSGWVKQLNHTRSTKTGGREQTDILLMVRQ